MMNHGSAPEPRSHREEDIHTQRRPARSSAGREALERMLQREHRRRPVEVVELTERPGEAHLEQAAE